MTVWCYVYMLFYPMILFMLLDYTNFGFSFPYFTVWLFSLSECGLPVLKLLYFQPTIMGCVCKRPFNVQGLSHALILRCWRLAVRQYILRQNCRRTATWHHFARKSLEVVDFN
jgi:hypothetical protein